MIKKIAEIKHQNSKSVPENTFSTNQRTRKNKLIVTKLWYNKLYAQEFRLTMEIVWILESSIQWKRALTRCDSWSNCKYYNYGYLPEESLDIHLTGVMRRLGDNRKSVCMNNKPQQNKRLEWLSEYQLLRELIRDE